MRVMSVQSDISIVVEFMEVFIRTGQCVIRRCTRTAVPPFPEESDRNGLSALSEVVFYFD